MKINLFFSVFFDGQSFSKARDKRQEGGAESCTGSVPLELIKYENRRKTK